MRQHLAKLWFGPLWSVVLCRLRQVPCAQQPRLLRGRPCSPCVSLFASNTDGCPSGPVLDWGIVFRPGHYSLQEEALQCLAPWKGVVVDLTHRCSDGSDCPAASGVPHAALWLVHD